MLGRGASPAGPVSPRFRCRVCQAFVQGTELGNCPRCGGAAPIVTLPVTRAEAPMMAGGARRRRTVIVALGLALLGLGAAGLLR